MRKRTIVGTLGLLTLVLVAPFLNSVVTSQSAPRIVYVVLCVDSEMWGGHEAYLGNTTQNPTMDMRAYALSPPSTVS